MAAPRATQFIALRNLARSGHHQQVRNLHMTGPATYASPMLARERPITNLPRDLAGLRAECKRRKIDAVGSKQELTARLNADELVHSRAFSTLAEKRPTASPAAQQSEPASKPAMVRHFNTSRTLKAVNDTSTIDFAYLPDMTSDAQSDAYAQVRVPILPDLHTPAISRAKEESLDDAPVMKPQINVLSADAVFLPMADMTDGHAMHIDFHAMADTVARNLRRMQVPVEQQASAVKQLFNDMVDDVLGVKAVHKA